MKQLKIILIVLGLVLTGFVGGFFTHRAIVAQQFERIRDMGRGGPKFGQHLLNTLEATEEQREQLAPVLKEYGQRMRQQSRENRMNHKMIVDSMHMAIKPYLTEEQVQKVDEFAKRFRERRKKPRPPGKRRPPRESKE